MYQTTGTALTYPSWPLRIVKTISRTPDWADQLCQQVANDRWLLHDGVVDEIATVIKIGRTVDTVA